MIKLSNISKTYTDQNGHPITALRSINLTVQPGEIFGVIGKSGAGKSTLIRCINLLEQPNQGQVFVAEQEINALPLKALRRARQGMGMIFQHFNLIASKTVFENIALPLRLVKTNAKTIHERVSELLALTDLTAKKNIYPNQLSGGQKQRVAIARALANQPKILLCDEATSALDPQTTKSILQLLQAINQKLGLTIVLITHEMEVIKQICDRVAIIDQGKIIEQNDVVSFFTKPQTKLAKSLVEACFERELPHEIQSRFIPEPQAGSHPIVHIHFHGKSAKEPIITYLIKTMNLDINILQANIEVVKQEVLGNMVVEISCGSEELIKIKNYLTKKNVMTEVIGYVDSINT